MPRLAGTLGNGVRPRDNCSAAPREETGRSVERLAEARPP